MVINPVFFIEMLLEDRVILIWLSWIIGGLCGVVILLVIICYCRLMPRHQKSFDEQYMKDHYGAKECLPSHSYSQEGYWLKHAEVQVQRHNRPVSYGGQVRAPTHRLVDAATGTNCESYQTRPQVDHRSTATQYASSSMLDELENEASLQALKTRSLPAFLRPPRPRPLSTEDDLQQLYAKVSLSKKYKNRMRNEHAAIIALSKSQSQCLDADAVIVYDQRTAL